MKRREVPISEITLRKFEKPYGDRTELLRKFCISIGLLQPGDSRDSIVEVLSTLLKAGAQRRLMTSEEFPGDISRPNLRRHLRRLAELGIVEKTENRYRIREFLTLREILMTHTKPFLVETAFSRILDYADAIESL